MNKNENNNKKLDTKELETVSGGELSEEKHKKLLESFKNNKFPINKMITAYGGPSLPQFMPITPHINLKEKFKVTESPDTPKTDALLPDKPENTKE